MTDRNINAPISKIVEAYKNRLLEYACLVCMKPDKDEQRMINIAVLQLGDTLASLGGEEKNHTYFRAVSVSERLPIKDGEYAVRSVNKSKPEFELTDTVRFVNGKFIDAPNWQHLYWLEQVQPPHPSERDASLGEEELYCTQKDQVWIWKKGEPKPLFQAASYFYAKLICKELNAGCSHPSEREVLEGFREWNNNKTCGFSWFSQDKIDRYLAEKHKTEKK